MYMTQCNKPIIILNAIPYITFNIFLKIKSKISSPPPPQKKKKKILLNDAVIFKPFKKLKKSLPHKKTKNHKSMIEMRQAI